MARSFRAYFVVVGLFALWVGAWGYLVPSQVDRALPWTVPPLHARFIAAMYLAGLLAMGLSLAQHRLSAVRIATALAALWTGALMLISLLHLGDFDFAKPQVWFWFGAYAVFPLWGAWLYFMGGASGTAEPRGRADPALIVVAALCLVLAAALFFAPAAMVRAWPWNVSPLLANIYAGPFFAWGVCAILLAREARGEARRIVLAGMLAFAMLAIGASLLHLKLFHFDGAAAWVWFVGFALAGAIVGRRLFARRSG